MARASAAKKSKRKTKVSRKRSKMPSRRKKAKKTAKKTKMKKKTKAKKKTTKKLSKKKTAKRKITKTAKKKTAASKKSTTKRSTRKPQLRKVSNPKSESASSLELPRPLALVENKIGVGDQAPNFQLPDQNGQMHSLDQYRGKNVVLYFYPKDDTPGCTREACSFRDNILRIENKDAVILGVSLDDTDSHKKFAEKYNLNFSLLSDTDKEVAQAYGVYTQKNMYGKTYMGVERSTFVIDKEGKIAAAFRGVKVDGHTEEVLAELEKLS